MAISRCSVQSEKRQSVQSVTDIDYSCKEDIIHGTSVFPVAIYQDDIEKEEVLWHWHEEMEAGTVTNGFIQLEVCGKMFILGTGDLFFINSGVLHSVVNPFPNRPSELQSLVFDSSLIGNEGSIFYNNILDPLIHNQRLSERIIRKNDPQADALLHMLQTAWHAISEETEDYYLIARNELSRFLSHIAKTSYNLPEQPDTARQTRVHTMLKYIHDNYEQRITLEDIAGSASVSVSEALRCFKTTLNVSPVRYLKKYRLSRAAQLLTETDRPVTEISELCGFYDASYFTEQFRLWKGCTPSQYRRK
ncbi:MAG: AraC family transcriptional regulator [Erysipelotrichaceae bacterium]|nr:AraC family transcriptional regulator [Erysipelotrichaceae bacterium]